jgi:hypothetical protein
VDVAGGKVRFAGVPLGALEQFARALLKVEVPENSVPTRK